jgi:hypothetical protein
MYKNIINTSSSGATTITGNFWLNNTTLASITVTTIRAVSMVYNGNLSNWIILSSSNNTGL